MIATVRKAQLQQMGLPSDVELIRRARMFVMQAGLTTGELADLASVNPNSLRVYLSGSYGKHRPADSNTLPIRAALKEAIDLHEIKHRSRSQNAHHPTAEFNEIRASMFDALADGSAVLVDGPPGIGKSWALENVAAEINKSGTGRAIYVYCTIGLSPQSFLVECCTEAGIPNRGNKIQLLRKLGYFFQEEHPLLVVDEAQNLPFETLETLRSLFDMRGYGIVLAASYDLLTRLREYKLRMWSSRVSRTHLLKGVTKEEAAQILVKELGPMSKQDIADTIEEATLEAVRERAPFKYIALRNLFWAIKGARQAVAAAQKKEKGTA